MANYTLIGGDQRQYGPVTKEQLQQWIREGRVNLQSQVKADSDPQWRPISQYAEFADMFRSTPTASQPNTVLRRLLWSFYAWPITLLLVTAATAELVSKFSLLLLLDTAISFPSLVALQLHIWDKRFLSGRFWKPYAFVYPMWDLIFNLLLQPMNSGEPFHPWSLVIPVLLLPLYVSVFRYAFRNWVDAALITSTPE